MPVVCPACGNQNPSDVQFCAQCHATLIFRCPHCRHEQPEPHICGKCGTDIDNFWRAQLATAQAKHIKEDADHRERFEHLRDSMRSQNVAAPDPVPLAASPFVPAPLGLIVRLLFKWFLNRWRRFSE
jgi:Double zinc ribbon